jgi:hypothetical protein
MANYRSAVQYVEQAKLRSIELGHNWTDNMRKSRGLPTGASALPGPLPRTQFQT